MYEIILGLFNNMYNIIIITIVILAIIGIYYCKCIY